MLESRIGYAARNRISAHVNHHYYVPSIPSLGGEIDGQKDGQIDIVQASDFWSRLQMKAGVEKSTDTREITHDYCKLGITRSILRCVDAVAMRSCTDMEHRPIRISRVGVDIILHDGIPLH